MVKLPRYGRRYYVGTTSHNRLARRFPAQIRKNNQHPSSLLCSFKFNEKEKYCREVKKSSK